MNNEPLRPTRSSAGTNCRAASGEAESFLRCLCRRREDLGDAGRSTATADEGLDIVVGVVQTHGRKDTAAMLEELAVLPPKRLAYRGRHISEFDLDAALARRPALILMDELAHSNAPVLVIPNAGRILKSCWKQALMFLLPSTFNIWKA